MATPDFISDEEFSAMTSGGTSAPDFISDDDVAQLVTSSSRPHWNLVDAAKQLGSGAVEGTAGLFGLVGDLSPSKLLGIGPKSSVRENFQNIINQYAPAPEEDYRYSREIGNFLGPTLALGGAGKLAQGAAKAASPVADFFASMLAPTSVAGAVTGGAGAQFGEDVTKTSDNEMLKAAVPLVFSVVGGAAPSVFADALSLGRSVFRGATPDEIKGSAALAQKELTGLSADDISKAIKSTPDDELGRLMTTAEVTDNAGMAQVEKQLAAAGQNSATYARLNNARNEARDAIINDMTPIQGANREGLGTALIEKASTTQEGMNEVAQKLWEKVPRRKEVEVGIERARIAAIRDSRQAGLEAGPQVRKLVDQFMSGEKLTSGALQDIRSDALSLLRDSNPSPYEKRLLAALQEGADSAVQRKMGGLYDSWKSARDATAAERDVFGRTRAGGSLVNPDARPANVLQNAIKGDSRSITELRAALGNDPELLDQVKRGMLDMIPRKADTNELTAAGLSRFLASNEGAAKTLLGEDHYGALTRIAEDLKSRARVDISAHLASRGQSATAQKMTVAGAMADVISDSSAGGGKGFLGKIINAIRESVGATDKSAIQDLMFKAALEPKFALELAEAPTTVRVLSGLERLQEMAANVAISGSRAATLEVATSGDDQNARQMSQTLRSDRGSPEGVAQYYSNSTQPFAANQSAQKPSSAPLASSQNRPQSPASLAPPSLTGSRTPRSDTSVYPQTTATLSPSSYSQGDTVINPSNSKEFDNLLDAIKYVESRGNSKAVSAAGAQGAYQIMPETGREYHRKQGLTEPYDPFNESQARMIAAAILNDYARMFDGDMEKAVLAYHSGPGNVKKGKIGPAGKAYVPAVEKALSKILTEV